jgi:class 3 adenylate cyclase
VVVLPQATSSSIVAIRTAPRTGTRSDDLTKENAPPIHSKVRNSMPLVDVRGRPDVRPPGAAGNVVLDGAGRFARSAAGLRTIGRGGGEARSSGIPEACSAPAYGRVDRWISDNAGVGLQQRLSRRGRSPSSLAAAREALARRRWAEAYELLVVADRESELGAEDLEDLAEACHAQGRPDEAIRAHERSYAAYEARGDRSGAGRVALTLAADHMPRSSAVAGGWISAANRLLELLPESAGHAQQALFQGMALSGQGDAEGASAEFKRANEIAHRVAAVDLEMVSRVFEAVAVVNTGRIEEGMRLVDEAMAAAVSGRLRPSSATLVYCHTLEACVGVMDLRRALEWTDVARDCAARDGLVPATGDCRLHRASVLRHRGEWAEAEREARGSASVAWAASMHPGEAIYEIGEIQLLRGDLAAAEEAFQGAVDLGRRPQPGLARLRLAQGRLQAALTGINDAVAEEPRPLERSRLLPAQAEIALAADDHALAARAVERLRRDVEHVDSPGKQAELASTEGAVALASRDVEAAYAWFRRAAVLWRQMGSPYEVARARVRIGEVLEARGDRDAAAMELRGAVATFEQLGAVRDARQAIVALTRLEGALESEIGATRAVHRAFLFTDIVRSTELITVIGDEAWADLLRWHDQTLGALFGKHRGEEVDHAGDGFLVVFADADDALNCAIEIQRTLADHRRTQGFAPQVRIGVHGDEATYSGRHFSGRGVHKAARIASLAESGEILATRTIVERRPGIGEPRTLTLKGLPEAVEVVSLAWRPNS